ncbi:MAG: hypothetical protein CMJ58_04565 [Planctomycetaceae bacterium]|nr:hypothetical protein [Planctomycetaceae bacterium]
MTLSAICRTSKRLPRQLGAIAAIMAVCGAGTGEVLGQSRSEMPERELLLVGRDPVQAEWLGGDSETGLQFRTADGEERIVRQELVRWGGPVPRRSTAEAWLTDGTQLALADSWLGDPPLVFNGQQLRASVAKLGTIPLPADSLSAAFWNLPCDPQRRWRRTARLHQIAGSARDADRAYVLLESGDVVAGEVESIAPLDDGQGGGESVVAMTTDLGDLQLPTTRLWGVRLQSTASEKAALPAPAAKYVVTLRDGSRLIAAKIAAADDGCRITLFAGGLLHLANPRDVAGIELHGSRVRYLSDEEPASAEPSSAPGGGWPFTRDASVSGGPLAVRGRFYPKGLGMHAPARVEYAVPAGAERFAAAVAVDDSARGGGSVVFRVLVRNAGSDQWHEAATTDVLRGDDPAELVTVDVRDAAQVALCVDAADRGDELDRAVWLDARWELAAED